MRQLLSFATEQDALDFQSVASAAMGYPLNDGITVRYDNVGFDYATGRYLHLFDDVLVAAGVALPKTAIVVADESTVQLRPTPMQAALVEMGQTKEEAIATVAADATLVALAVADAVADQPVGP